MNGVPRHVAVIMDGNGRWAARAGKPRLEGHRAGAVTVERLVDWCLEIGVEYLTLYAFSTENWSRPKEEVTGLMGLLSMTLGKRAGAFARKGVHARAVGRLVDLPLPLQRRIAAVEKKTASCSRLHLQVALSYGGRAEIADAACAYARDVLAGKADCSEPLPDAAFRQYLYAPDVPDPDLVIRTSGEFRLSNFLLWQCAYAEFWSTPVMWPDFSRADFDEALAVYAARDRRMGGRRT